jgi:hypothetical protein
VSRHSKQRHQKYGGTLSSAEIVVGIFYEVRQSPLFIKAKEAELVHARVARFFSVQHTKTGENACQTHTK